MVLQTHGTNLKEVVEKYLQLAGGFDRETPLESFGLSSSETEQLFSVWDEDYQISRYIRWSAKTGARAYNINGYPQTHIVIAAGIREIL